MLNNPIQGLLRKLDTDTIEEQSNKKRREIKISSGIKVKY